MNETVYMLTGIIALLVVIVGVLLWRYFNSQDELSEKNDVIIRGIHENIQLRDELQRRLSV